MKKLGIFLSLFMLLTAFTCENEPLDEAIDPSGNLSCEQATLNTANAVFAFLNASEENYTELCLAYKTAIQNQIEACGDEDGSLQAAYDALGDCGDTVIDDCQAAIEYVQTTQSAYLSASEENYSQLCSAYADALQNQIDICGDDDGSLQATIDELGDCVYSQNTPDQELSLVAGTLSIDFEEVNVVVENEMIKVSGTDTSPGSVYSIYFEVEESATGEGIIQNFELTLTSVFYPSELDPPFDFTSNIEINEGGQLVGSFGGLVQNEDGGDLNLSSGVINISY